ncbi:hypothetical protein DPX16_11555 [Anabarilius grahami]|uniref:Uncharacterized protein n=1 Tax=Anabarilius grahami TaxID=495550 RepID=A0A3N0YIZ3_ANAGA|nr:hypothetical protein DPX16_11555 [Anabarilius grahami]
MLPRCALQLSPQDCELLRGLYPAVKAALRRESVDAEEDLELWAEGLCLLTQPVGAHEIPPLWNTATVAQRQPYTTGNRLGDSVTVPSQREHSLETGSPKVQQGAVL